MDEGESPLLFKLARSPVGLVVGVAVQQHFRPAGRHRAHLHLGGGHGHHDHGRATQALGGQGDALGVVPGTGGDHTPGQLLTGEADHAVVGAAQLEAEHRLQVLPLEQHLVAQAPRQVGGRVERGFDRHVVNAGAQDTLQVGAGQRVSSRAKGIGDRFSHSGSLAIADANGRQCRRLPEGTP